MLECWGSDFFMIPLPFPLIQINCQILNYFIGWIIVARGKQYISEDCFQPLCKSEKQSVVAKRHNSSISINIYTAGDCYLVICASLL